MATKMDDTKVVGLLVLMLSFILGTTSDGDIESARCRVRCLAHLKHQLGGPSGERSSNQVTFEKCFQDKNCATCARPCSQPSVGRNHCLQICQRGEDDCEQSCNFLGHLHSVRPGSCPPPDQTTNKLCSESCDRDADCDGIRKCCDNGCGHVCENPLNIYVGVPEIPLIIRVRERSTSGTVEVKWLPSATPSAIPILYMVQGRYNVGQHASERHMSDWSQLAQTTSTLTLIRDVGAGRWYEFRVAAVGINGTRGFSPPTKAYRINKEPEVPSPPQNITEGQTVLRDNKVFLTVHWNPPAKTDLPIHRYKIFWHRRLQDNPDDHSSTREYKKIVSGKVTQYQLEELEPDTEYTIQVQAISSFGDTRLKSDRATAHMRTYSSNLRRQSFSRNDYNDLHTTTRPALTSTNTITATIASTTLLNSGSGTPELWNVQLGPAFFQNGLLKVNMTWNHHIGNNDKVTINWSADTCIADDLVVNLPANTISDTTDSRFFILYDLRFDCRYIVKLLPTSPKGQQGPVTSLSFQTPSCGKVEVIGDVKPHCPTEEPKVREELKIHHSLLIRQTNITARISWHHPPANISIVGYHIIWGLAAAADPDDYDAQPAMEQETASSQLLPKETTSYTIGTLEESTSYIVEVHVMYQDGSVIKASRQFTTPVLQPSPILPPFEENTDNLSKKRGAVSQSTFPPMSATQTSWPSIYKTASSHDRSCGPCISQSNLWILLITTLVSVLL